MGEVSYISNFFTPIKETVKLFIDFGEKDTLIIDKKRAVFIFFIFDP